MCVWAELQVIVKAEVRPQPNRTAVVDEKAAAAVQPHALEEEEQKEREASTEQSALPVLITVLLLVPLLLIISTGLFICWRRNGKHDQLLVTVFFPHASAMFRLWYHSWCCSNTNTISVQETAHPEAQEHPLWHSGHELENKSSKKKLRKTNGRQWQVEGGGGCIPPTAGPWDRTCI